MLRLRYSLLFSCCRLLLQTKLDPHVILGPSETLRISFTVLDKDSGKGVIPHQTFLRLYDPVTHEEGVHPIKVSAGGKGKIDIVCSLQLYYISLF
jgi:oligosaccharyltransferase complex subunit delta (ribophorin II)